REPVELLGRVVPLVKSPEEVGAVHRAVDPEEQEVEEDEPEGELDRARERAERLEERPDRLALEERRRRPEQLARSGEHEREDDEPEQVELETRSAVELLVGDGALGGLAPERHGDERERVRDFRPLEECLEHGGFRRCWDYVPSGSTR